jgi:hypothetical protein
MPRLEMGPYLAKLRVGDDEVELVETVRLSDPDGRPVPGCPQSPTARTINASPLSSHDGKPIAPDAAGMDTEGVAALRDGRFWLGRGIWPSLALVERSGRIVRRWFQPVGTRAGETVDRRQPPALAGAAISTAVSKGLPSPSEERSTSRFKARWRTLTRTRSERRAHVRLWELDATGNSSVNISIRSTIRKASSATRKDKPGWKDSRSAS